MNLLPKSARVLNPTASRVLKLGIISFSCLLGAALILWYLIASWMNDRLVVWYAVALVIPLLEMLFLGSLGIIKLLGNKPGLHKASQFLTRVFDTIDRMTVGVQLFMGTLLTFPVVLVGVTVIWAAIALLMGFSVNAAHAYGVYLCTACTYAYGGRWVLNRFSHLVKGNQHPFGRVDAGDVQHEVISVFDSREMAYILSIIVYVSVKWLEFSGKGSPGIDYRHAMTEGLLSFVAIDAWVSTFHPEWLTHLGLKLRDVKKQLAA